MLSLLNLLKTIGFVDWNWKGHHPTYFKNLGGGFLEAGWRVAAFCPSGAVSELPQVSRRLFQARQVQKTNETVPALSQQPHQLPRVPPAKQPVRVLEPTRRQVQGLLRNQLRSPPLKHRPRPRPNQNPVPRLAYQKQPFRIQLQSLPLPAHLSLVQGGARTH